MGLVIGFVLVTGLMVALGSFFPGDRPGLGWVRFSRSHPSELATWLGSFFPKDQEPWAIWAVESWDWVRFSGDIGQAAKPDLGFVFPDRTGDRPVSIEGEADGRDFDGKRYRREGTD